MTIDRDKLWTGDLNRHALDPQSHTTVGLYDTTLRDGEQTVGVVLSPEDKLEIARALDAAGVDRIEAGFPRVSEEDAEAIRLIAEADCAPRSGASRAPSRADVEALVELGVRHAVVESPISDLKLERSASSRDSMVDGSRPRSRSRPTTASRSRSSASTPPAPTSTSTGGPTPPRSRPARARWWRSTRSGSRRPKRPRSSSADRRVGRRARALARPQRLRPRHGGGGRGGAGGGDMDPRHVNGMGERAGNANLLEVALALEALYGIPTRLDWRGRALAALVRERAGYELEPWKPLTGENLYTRESGAVASQFHDPPAIEPYSSELVGAERRIVLGKKSGLDSIRIKAAELGLELPPERYPELLAEVKALGAKKRRLVTDQEFRRLARRPPPDASID